MALGDKGNVPSHHEKLTNHASTLADVLLHQLRARDTNERALSMVSDGTSKQSLASARRAVENHSLRLRNAKRLEELGMLDWQLNDLLDFTNLLVETTHHIVGGVGNLLDLHQTDKRIDLVWQNLVQSVAVVTKRYTGGRDHQRDIDALVQVDNILTLGMNLLCQRVSS